MSWSSIGSRAWKVLTGFGGSAQAPLGFVKDMALAPFADEEIDGIMDILSADAPGISDIFGSFSGRAGQAIERSFSPEAGLGAFVGGLPEGVRHERVGGALAGAAGGAIVGASAGGPLGALAGGGAGTVYGGVRGSVDQVIQDWENVYNAVWDNPISTLATVGSLADAPGGGGIPGLFRASNWREAWDIATEGEGRTWGQSLATALLTEDVANNAEVARAQGTDTFRALSGVIDAVGRFKVDPDILVARAAIGARLGRASATPGFAGGGLGGAAERLGARAAERLDYGYIRPITSKGEAAAAAFDSQVVGVLKEMDGMSPARIREKFFPDHEHGARISAALAEPDNFADRQLVMGALVGDSDALATLFTRRADLAGPIDRLVGDQAAANQLTRAGFKLPTGMADDIKVRIQAEVEQLYGEAAKLDRILDRPGVIGDLQFASPQARFGRKIRDDLPRSEFFQESIAAAPLRVAYRLGRMRPGPFVGFDTPDGDITLKRMLDQAKVDADAAESLRSAYIRAQDPTQRMNVWDQAVDEVHRGYFRRAGFDPDDAADRQIVESFMDELAESKRQAKVELDQSRAYSAEGHGRIEMPDEAGGGTQRVSLPVWLTQEANYGAVPNLDLMEEAAKKLGRLKNRYGDLPDFTGKATSPASRMKDLAVEAAEGFHRAWKPSVLLRLGWPIRVVGEEQIRIAAKIGAMNQASQVLRDADDWALGGAVQDAMRKLDIGDVPEREVFGLPQLARKAGRRAEEEGISRTAAFRQLWSEESGRLGLSWYNVDGHRVQSAFGSPQDGVDIHKALVGQTANLNARIYDIEDDLIKEMRRQTGNWKTLQGGDPNFGKSWEQALNRQVAQDAVGRRLLEGSSVDEVVEWLRKDPTGQAYLQRSPLYRGAKARGHSLEETVSWQKAEVEDLTLGNRELAEKAAKRNVKVDDLRKVEADAANWPNVHGGIVEEGFGGSQIGATIRDLSSKAHRALGGYPSTVLSRNRLFKFTYDAEVERLIRLLDDDLLTDEVIANIQKKARETALTEVRKTLFDLSEQSNLAEALRFVSPFFMAQQEILTRWAGLAAHNPAFIAKMHEVWRSPEKAGIVVDENGARIRSDGTAVQPLTGEQVEPGEDHYLMLPDPLAELPGLEMFDNARFNKEGLNIALQLSSAVGTGPLVQVPVNEIIKDRPELEDSVKMVLPFGATQDTLSLIMPATLKRIRTQARDEDTDEYRNSLIRIYYDEVTAYNLGERDTKPTYDEVKRKTDEFWNMRIFSNFVAPAAPWFISPYQQYIDAYRSAQTKYREWEEQNPDAAENLALGGQTPDEWFLDKFGAEYFALTQSVSKSVDGVPPSVEGHLARKKYQDMIEQFPELGSLIIGKEGAGEFSRAVYEAQKETPVRPGAEETQREGQSFEEAAAAPGVQLGWIEFSKTMDMLEAEMFNRGLPNMQVKEAEDLAFYKKQMVNKIAEKHPEWYQQYVDFDPLKQQRKLTGMKKIVQDDQLRQRPEIQGLADYLDIRGAFVAELQRQREAGGASTLTSRENQDLRLMWETVVNQIKDRNLAFSSLHSRWLANDLPSAADGQSPADFGDERVA